MVGVQSNVMAAMAVEQDATQAHLAHLAKGNLDRAAVSVSRRVTSNWAGHAVMKAAARPKSKSRSVAGRDGMDLPPVVGVDSRK